MIYKKEANFPYPLLTNQSLDYPESEFYFTVELLENSETYHLHVETTLTSAFMNDLLAQRQAELVLVIQAKDTKFYPLSGTSAKLIIPKARITLNQRTMLQVQIRTKTALDFSRNAELSPFYEAFRADITVAKNYSLGFSNIITFDSQTKKSFVLFEKQLRPELDSEIKLELTPETIVIAYRNESFQMVGLPNQLHNLYVYMGLRMALSQFIAVHADEGEEGVVLAHILAPEEGLHLKLYQLMQQKAVNEVSDENLDAVISQIADQMVMKFTRAIRGLEGNAV